MSHLSFSIATKNIRGKSLTSLREFPIVPPLKRSQAGIDLRFSLFTERTLYFFA